MVVNKLNLSLNEPFIRQAYAKQGDTGRVFNIEIDPTPSENGTLRILRPDGVEVTSDAESSVSPTITDGMATFDALEEAEVTSLKVGISPIQDLHGYGYPWPAGGRGNICPNVGWSQGQLGNNGTQGSQTYSITSDYIFLKAGTYKLWRHYQSKGDGQMAYHTYNTSKVWQADSGWVANNSTMTIDNDCYIRLTTRFSVNYDITPSIIDNGLYVVIQAGSTDITEWQPYSNICPIYGHTDMNVYQVGKNLFPIDVFTSAGQGNVFNNYALALPSGTYTLSWVSNVARTRAFSISFGLADGTSVEKSMPTTDSSATFTANAPITKLTWYVREASDVKNIQLEKGSTATSYQPYLSHTYPLSLGQTVYGGTLDVVSGKLTVDKVNKTFNGSESWQAHGSIASWFYVDGLVDDAYENGNANNFAITNLYAQEKYSLAAAMVNGQFALGLPTGGTHNRIVIKDTRFTTVAEFETALASQNLQLCYELATPIEVDLTPTQISTLLGENNVWSDGEITELTFDYGKLLSVLTADQTAVVGRCIGDVELNGVSTMPFTLVVQKNNQGVTP